MANERVAFVPGISGWVSAAIARSRGYRFVHLPNGDGRSHFFSLLYGDAEEVVIEATRQGGKALAVNTPILTTIGWKTMGSITVGDYVFSPDGTSPPVVAKSEVFTDHDCYRLHFSDGQSIVADAGHQWTFRDSENNEVVTITTEQLAGNTHWSRYGEPQSRYRYAMPEPYKTTEQNLPLDPYVLGHGLVMVPAAVLKSRQLTG